MNPVTQPTFEGPTTFDDDGMALHRHSASPSEDLVLFVHGLGGSGNGTWRKFPEFVFDSPAKHDVAIFDYRTFHRRLTTFPPVTSGLSFFERQLVAGIRGLPEYERIHLVGHSLGGLVSDAALKRVVHQPPGQMGRPLHQLASLTYFASPRLGTGMAVPGIRLFLSELQALKRLSKRGNDLSNFFTDQMTSDLRDPAVNHKVWLPRFACIASGETFLGEFSATFAIPDTQQLLLNGNHSSIVKPKASTYRQVTWLLENIDKVNNARQRIREQNYRTRRVPRTVRGRSVLVTEYWGVQSGEWESVYNDVRRESSTGEITVEDHRDVPPDAAIDLLIAVSEAGEVLAGNQHDKQKVANAANRARADYALTVGLATVGDDHKQALPVINAWLANDLPPAMWVRGATDERDLKFALSDWIQNVLRRDPRGGTPQMAGRGPMTVLEQPGQIGDLA